MKLPEYDNRPSAGQPLYHDHRSNPEGEGIKFMLLAVLLPLAGVACLAIAVIALLRAILN